MVHWYELEVYRRARSEDLVRAIEHQRLIRATREGRQPEPARLGPWLIRLGSWLMIWGWRLQAQRLGASSIPSALEPHRVIYRANGMASRHSLSHSGSAADTARTFNEESSRWN